MDLTIIESEDVTVLEIDDNSVTLEVEESPTSSVIEVDIPTDPIVIEVMAGLKGDPGEPGASGGVTSINGKTGVLTGFVELTGTQAITGIKNFTTLQAEGPGALQLKPAAADHSYLSLFARTASPSTRSAFIGFGSGGTTQLSITNEITNGDIALQTTGTGVIRLNSPVSVATLTAGGTITAATLTSTGNINIPGTAYMTHGTAGIAAPTFNSYSAGMKVVLYDQISSTSAGMGFGVETGGMFANVRTTSDTFRWYGGITAAATLTGAGALSTAGAITAGGTGFTGSGANLTGLTKTQVGLANVDNTSDANKPVSTATQTALNLKANLASPSFSGNITATGGIIAGGVNFPAVPSGGASAAFAAQIATNNSTIAGVGVLTNDGTRNRRAALVMNDTDAVWGLTHTATTGVVPFVIKMASVEAMRLTELGAATFASSVTATSFIGSGTGASTLAGSLAVTGQFTSDAVGGGSGAQFKPGSVDHVHLDFFARTATPGTRTAFIGYSAPASSDFFIYADTGNIAFRPSSSTGTVNVTQGYLQESGQRVFSPNNPPTYTQVGAAATVHGHALTDANITGIIPDAQLPPRLQPISSPLLGGDINTLTSSGFYTANSSSANAPVAGQWWYILVQKYTGGNVLQRATRMGSKQTYERYYDATTWGAWYEVANDPTLFASSTHNHDASYVSLTGTQTIAGAKTFSSNIGAPAVVVNASGYSATLLSNTISFTRASANYISAGTAGGTINFLATNSTSGDVQALSIGQSGGVAISTFTGNVVVPDSTFTIAKTTGLQSALDAKAPLASPTFTGTVTVPNASFTVAKISATGTASSSTYLRGDGTWATPAGGGGGSSTLAGLTDVTITAAATGDFVRYNGTAWVDAIPVIGDISGLQTALDGKSATTHGHALTDANITGVLPIAQVPTGTSGTTVALGNHGHALTDANITGILPIAQVPTGTTSTTVALGNHNHDASYVALTGAQTIAGIKTFSSAPVVPDASFTIAKTSGLQTALDAKAPLASPTFTGTVAGITKAMVGLGSVDNTADSAKPVSTAQQTALNLKANLASPTFTGTVTVPDGSWTIAKTTGLQTALDGKSATTHGHALTDANITGVLPIAQIPTGTTGTTVALGNHDHAGVYEPVLSAGTSAQYYRGDKTWQTLDKAAVGLGNVTNAAQVELTGNQTIAGTKTFSSAPVVPDASFAIAKVDQLQAALDDKASIASIYDGLYIEPTILNSGVTPPSDGVWLRKKV